MNFDEACDKAGIPIISHEQVSFRPILTIGK